MIVLAFSVSSDITKWYYLSDQKAIGGLIIIYTVSKPIRRRTPTFNATIKLQNEMARKVTLENTQKNKTYVCGADVAYRNNIAYCCCWY